MPKIFTCLFSPLRRSSNEASKQTQKNRSRAGVFLVVVVAVMFLSAPLFVPAPALAEDPGVGEGSMGETAEPVEEAPTGTTGNWFVDALVEYGSILIGATAAAIFGLLETIFGTVLSFVEGIIGEAIDFSLNPEMMSAVVSQGWTIVRDVANMFFIFILLGISIMTILRYESYGAKQLLPRLIVVALLINFSLPITNTVVDLSNILAYKFYEPFTQDGELILSEKIMEKADVHKQVALKPMNVEERQAAYKKYEETRNEAHDNFIKNKKYDDYRETIKNAKDTLIQELNSGRNSNAEEITAGTFYTNMAMDKMLSSVMIIILIFVMIALAVLFFIRGIVIGFLAILSPMAFLFMVLPYTQTYANQWWSTLFKQALFAPVALFFLYLALGIDNQYAGPPIYQYIYVIIMLLASLIVSQKLGAVGAGTAIAWGKKGYQGAKGYAGRQAGRWSRQGVMRAAKPIAEGEGRVAGAIGRLPLVRKGAQKITAGRRKDIEEEAKKLESLNDKELKARFSAMGTLPTTRAAIANTLAKRGNLKKDEELGFTEERIEATKKTLGNSGMSAGQIDSLQYQYVNMEDEAKRNEALSNVSNSQVRKTLEEGGKGAEELIGAFKQLGGTVEEVAEGLREMQDGKGKNIGNRSLANYLQSGAMRNLISAMISGPAPAEPVEGAVRRGGARTSEQAAEDLKKAQEAIREETGEDLKVENEELNK